MRQVLLFALAPRRLGRLVGAGVADQVGGAVETEVLEAGGGEARRVPLGAEQDHLDVVIDRFGDAGVAGRVEPPLDVVALDDPKKVLPPGEVGEIRIRGPNVTKGYWNRPEETAEAFVGDRFLTGDIGTMDEDGYFYLVDRKKDMIISGGENIYPAEIEEFLYQHPDIEDVQVIGVPDEKYGEELAAWVKLKAGAEPLDADAVREFATGRLAHYKIPRYVMVVDEFPMTVTGKIRKVQMREESAEKLGL